MNTKIARRNFMGRVAAVLGYAGLAPLGLTAQARGRQKTAEAAVAAKTGLDKKADYDKFAKLANNENPYGPSDTVMKAMTDAWKYANRYGYPDGGIVEAIAELHKVKPENVVLGCGSSEILKIVDDAFLPDHKLVVGVDPTYETVYRYATNSKAKAIALPLTKTYDADMKGIIRATKLNARDVGLVYICNPNNPTGKIVPRDEIKLLLDSIPQDIPVFVDEAYHHFVEDSNYESSVKYILEGRKVIVARTFSKIAALAGMRLGYAVAPVEIIDILKPLVVSYNVNAVVKYGGVASLKDTAYEAKMKQLNRQIRDRTTNELKAMGYEVIPSQANFFMVNVKKDVTPVGEEFQKKGILVGRKFPPMNEWLRVSVGADDEMNRFMKAFKEIFPPEKTTQSKASI
ncbi:MAG TPA: aminotransferase class I/II-fold pyridoxal phosphate-dependent enzyme [Terriglobia bacterium]|nr:aminotransferase class I/II-fold pyridoxal phosphate-dependent enzyme [Terriglobia bacterium]